MSNTLCSFTINREENPFDLVDWTEVKYITFDPVHSMIKGFSELPLISFNKNGQWYHTSTCGIARKYGFMEVHKRYLQNEFDEYAVSIPAYAFTENGTAVPLKVLASL